MDNVIKPTEKQAPARASGVYVTGAVISSRAKVIKRKDGSGPAVVIEHEIATQPGVAVWTIFSDPKTDTSVRIDGERVIEFTKLKEFQQVTIRANRLRSDEHTGQLIIKLGELVA